MKRVVDGSMVAHLWAHQSQSDARNGTGKLSVEVRGGWHTPGQLTAEEACRPEEFCILLSTGGPALRIMGELDEHCQPTRAYLQYQDWGTPWTDYYETGIGEVLLKWASVFYFGD